MSRATAPAAEVVEPEPTPAVRGHDLEIFLPEIDRYGLWAASLEEAARVFAQVPLPGMEP